MLIGKTLLKMQLHIYIGDIGNNNGNRTDLKIYKISKSDFDDADNIVTAWKQFLIIMRIKLLFNSLPNNNNWDAEGLISFLAINY